MGSVEVEFVSLDEFFKECYKGDRKQSGGQNNIWNVGRDVLMGKGVVCLYDDSNKLVEIVKKK